MFPHFFIHNNIFKKRDDDVDKISISIDSTYQQIKVNEDDRILFLQQSQKYIDSKRELHSTLLEFLEKSEYLDDEFQDLKKIICTQKYDENKEEFEHFLSMI